MAHTGAGSPVVILTPHMQADNDLPVHLKGGGTDNALYRLTMTLTLGGECGPPAGLLGWWTSWDLGHRASGGGVLSR